MSTPPGPDGQSDAPVAPIPQQSGQPKSNSASIMWAVATIVVALVGGFLIYTAITHDSEPGGNPPAAGVDDGAVTADDEAAGASEPAGDSAGDEGEASAPRRGSDYAATDDAPSAAPTGESQPESAEETAEGFTPEQEQFLLDLQRRDAEDPLAQGDVDAPVVIIEYADYRCPFCAVWGRDVQPDLQDLVDDGTVRIEFRDRVIFGEESQATALAARAAGEQGLFWEFHDAVYAAAPSSGHPDMPREKLLGFAEDVGVPDLEQFEQDMDSPELLALVQADGEEAASIGVSSTPTFLVNTTPVVGAQPAEVFRAIVEEELAAVE